MKIIVYLLFIYLLWYLFGIVYLLFIIIVSKCAAGVPCPTTA